MELLIICIEITTGIVGIVALVKFFYLCSNVERIANGSTGIDDFNSKFKLLLAAGLNDEASKLLISYIQSDDQYFDAVLSKNHSSSSAAREHLHKAYDQHFKVLGMTLDFDKVDELYELCQKSNEQG